MPDTGGSGGALTDRTFQSFTSGSLTAQYHIYAAGINLAQPVGLMVQYHGDGAYEFDNPTDPYSLGGPRGLIAEAKRRNMILLACRAPDATGDVTWWESGTANALYAKNLIQSIGYNLYPISKVWLVGYSGGTQFITQYLVPLYPTMFEIGGGSIVFGGGDTPGSVGVTPATFSTTLKSGFRMHWYTGQQDTPANASDGFGGYDAAQAGATYYSGQGFTTTTEFPANTDHEQLANFFGPVTADVLTRYVFEASTFAAASSTTAQTFESVTGMTSGTWTRVTTTARTGTGSLRSPTVANSGQADAVFAVPTGALTVRFGFQTSTELDGDFLRLIVGSDDVQIQSGPSPYGWQLSPHYDVRGATSITFRYKKDSSTTAGTDQVWIDDVAFELAPAAATLAGTGALSVAATRATAAAATFAGHGALAATASGGITTVTTVPLPAVGDTDWLDWATMVHRASTKITDVREWGATGDGTTNDTTAIQAALTNCPPGGAVFLPQPPGGSYRTAAPLDVPSNITLWMSHTDTLQYTGAATSPNSIKPLASFSPTGGAVLQLRDKLTTSASVDHVGTRLVNVTIDGTSLTGGSDVRGITVIGLVREATFDHVTVRRTTGHGFDAATNTGGVGPQSLRFLGCVADNVGGAGFSLVNMPDTTLMDCNAQGSGWVGFYLAGLPNSVLIGCRAEWSAQYGFYVTSGYWGNGQGSGGIEMLGCLSDRNTYDGVFVDSTGADVVGLTGCRFRRDGRNGGTGAGGYAGVRVAATATMPVLATGCKTYPGVDDNGTGTNSPQYGLALASGAATVAWNGGRLWGATAATGGTGTAVIDTSVMKTTGATTAPTNTAPTA